MLVATEIHDKSRSPSKSAIYFICPKSVQFNASVKPEPPGEAALYGTDCHYLIEQKLRHEFNLIEFDEETQSIEEVIKSLKYYDDNMQELADESFNYVVERVNYHKERTGQMPIIFLEVTLDLSKYAPDLVGTLDCGIIAVDQMDIIDFKTGKRVVNSYTMNNVGVKEPNSQLGIYGLGLYYFMGINYEIKTVNLIILQYSINHFSSFSLSLADFLMWEEHVVIPAFKRTLEEYPEAVPNDMCCYCPGALICSARRKANLSLVENKPVSVEILSDDELDTLLAKANDMTKFAKELQELALKRLKTGVKLPNYKLVRGRGTRVFTDEKKAADILWEQNINPYKEQELKSMTDLEKELHGKKKFNDLLGGLVTTVEGALSVAPKSDSRPEVEIINEGEQN